MLGEIPLKDYEKQARKDLRQIRNDVRGFVEGMSSPKGVRRLTRLWSRKETSPRAFAAKAFSRIDDALATPGPQQLSPDTIITCFATGCVLSLVEWRDKVGRDARAAIEEAITLILKGAIQKRGDLHEEYVYDSVAVNGSIGKVLGAKNRERAQEVIGTLFKNPPRLYKSSSRRRA